MVNKVTKNDEMPKMKPTMHLSEDELKAVKKWVVGKNYKLAVDVRQTSQMIDNKKKVSAGFEILKVSPRQAKLNSIKKRSEEY